jgi:periplasmic protein CpxP/Spy
MKIKLMPMFAGAIALSVVATPFLVKAQANGPDPAQPTRAHHQGKWDNLNLSDQQKQQLEQIRKDTRTQIEAVFTPQQLEQLKAARQNHQPGQAPQPGQAHQGHRGGFMASLNLSDAQKAKIKEIMQAQKSRMQAVFTPAQQQQLQQMHQQRQQMWQQRQQQQNNQ